MYGIGMEAVGRCRLDIWEKLRLRAVVGAMALRRRHAALWVFMPWAVPFLARWTRFVGVVSWTRRERR
jgi:hypothetical protein